MKRQPSFRKVHLLACVLLMFISYGSTWPEKKEVVQEDYTCEDCNVLFISVTNLRYDHLGFNGYKRKTSPLLDSFSQKSIIFNNAYSVASWTLPVTMSIYSSTYPFTHNIMTRYEIPTDPSGIITSFTKLDKNTVTLVDILKNQNYTTVTFNTAKDFGPQHGLMDRFDTHLSMITNTTTRWGKYGSIYDVTPKTIEWLKANKTKKFFMHVQAYDPHCPFLFPRKNDMFDPDYSGDVDFSYCYFTYKKTNPIVLEKNGIPETCYNVKTTTKIKDLVDNTRPRNDIINTRLNERDIEHMKALYDGEIYNCDNEIGKILATLEELDLTKNTIIVFYSEHGDMFGKHGRFMRGGPLRGTFYDDVLHVPLLIYHPKLKHRRIKELVSLIDLAPTLLDFLKIPTPSDFMGKSAVPTLQGHSIRNEVFSGTLFIPNKLNLFFENITVIMAVRNQNYKLIKEIIKKNTKQRQTYYELYDMTNDPMELNNIAEKNIRQKENLDDILTKWTESIFNIDDALKTEAK